jgi:hypothetical protein
VAQPPRTTLNLYVDPNWGDDLEAGNRLEQMLTAHQTLPVSQWATNFPIPFRTINGSGSQPLGAIPALAVRGQRLVQYFDNFVVHLLPGLYGPSFGAPTCHPSGLVWNGDAFPIWLHDFISLQGTSSLDTIIDGRGVTTGPIFWCASATPSSFVENGTHRNSEWGVYRPQGAQTLSKVFVDGVTIRGAQNPGEPLCTGTAANFAPGGAAAGVFLLSESVPLSPIFSNCFITDNRAGVAIVSLNFAPNPTQSGNKLFQAHTPVFLNNTFFRNEVGFFDADDQSQSLANPPETVGRSHSHLVNNLFDNLSLDLAGVDVGLVTAVDYMVGGVLTTFTQNGGYINAFANPKVPASGVLVSTTAFQNSLPTCPTFRAIGTTTRPGRRPQHPAGSQLEFSPWGLGSAGLFYVYQRILPLDPSIGTHDLRTPLWVTPNGGTTWSLNPLIDQGIVPGPGPWPNTFRRVVVHPDTGAPGAPTPIGFGTGIPLHGGVVTASGLDNDCEGFCNPRTWVFTGPRYAHGQRGLTPIDIGADEVAPLVAGGFVQFTRTIDGKRVIPGTHNPPLSSAETGYWLLDQPGLGWPVSDAGNQAVWQSTVIECAAVSPLVLAPVYPNGTGWPPASVCWYGVFVSSPPATTTCIPAAWAFKPSLLPGYPDDMEGDAAPNVFVSGWGRMTPTSAHIHPPGLDGCVDFYPDIPPPQDPLPVPQNRLTGGFAFSGTGVWLVGVPRTSAESARRHNLASTVTAQVQTFAVRDHQ